MNFVLNFSLLLFHARTQWFPELRRNPPSAPPFPSLTAISLSLSSSVELPQRSHAFPRRVNFHSCLLCSWPFPNHVLAVPRCGFNSHFVIGFLASVSGLLSSASLRLSPPVPLDGRPVGVRASVHEVLGERQLSSLLSALFPGSLWFCLFPCLLGGGVFAHTPCRALSLSYVTQSVVCVPSLLPDDLQPVCHSLLETMPPASLVPLPPPPQQRMGRVHAA